MLPVGATAPDVVGYDVNGKASRLSALRGHLVVVYFYPRDETPGCTTEACAFRDVWARYQAAGVSVIGVSKDSRKSHIEFAHEHKLPFALVADTKGSVGRAWGVSSGLFGYERVSFLVGKDGHIVHVWPDVDPGVHAAQVLKVVKQIQAQDQSPP